MALSENLGVIHQNCPGKEGKEKETLLREKDEREKAEPKKAEPKKNTREREREKQKRKEQQRERELFFIFSFTSLSCFLSLCFCVFFNSLLRFFFLSSRVFCSSPNIQTPFFSHACFYYHTFLSLSLSLSLSQSLGFVVQNK